MSDELYPGLRVGRYQLLFRLGKGGMGEVWAAAQQSGFGLQKLLAVKVLRTKEASANAAVMFFDEAKAASSLQHAAIVNTSDLGQDGDVLYIAMDLVRGPSLTALLQRLVLKKQTMTPAIVAYLGVQLASALDYAHERATFEGKKLNLVHRDVSPHNVLLDLQGNVRLTDFGVARTSIQEHLSHVGTVRGKPSYMAPEQVVGGDIDARTDIFSLGIVLYECSCLRRLFGRSNPVKSMDAVLKHTPKPLVELVSGFPPELDQAIARALKKDPKERYSRAAEFAEALAEVTKTLDGGGTASLDLANLIDRTFEKDAFELDGRVQEALAAASVLGESEPPEVETRLERTPTRPPKQETYVGQLGTRVAWPTVAATDPLAPEALEEARTTMFAANTPSIPMPMATLQSVDGFTPANGNTGQSMVFQQRRTTGTMVVLLCSAAILLLAAAFAVVRANRSSPSSSEQATIEAVAPSPSAGESPSASAAVRAQQMPATAATPTPNAEEDESQPSKTGRKAAPQKRISQPAVGSGPRHAEGEVDPKPARAERTERSEGNATRDQVLRLIRQVKAVDPKAASEMYPTLNEAGSDNIRVLNELRARAQSILAARGE